VKIIGVTQRKLCNNFYERIEEISKYNLDYLILREKDLNDEELENMANEIKSIFEESQIKLIINGNINVAIKINAYGVQLSFKDFCKGIGHEFLGIKGVSVHSLKESLISEKKGADYLLYGHIYQTDCKKELAPRGIEKLKEICESVKIPVYAIGGINEKNFHQILEVGASGIALMSSLMRGLSIDAFRSI
jgi:thiamine-phosphate pyrophosphorylase